MLGYPGPPGSPPTAIPPAQSHQLLALFPSMQQALCYLRGHRFTIALKGSQRFLGRGHLTPIPETEPFSTPCILLSSPKSAVHSLGDPRLSASPTPLPLLPPMVSLWDLTQPPRATDNLPGPQDSGAPCFSTVRSAECRAGVPAVTHRSWLQPSGGHVSSCQRVHTG